ncbi:DUF2130 domain-containing protein [Candidatus Microgenomates bacterium]|jgi:hypothetical protein|nr:MAG: DUF2130 domain-containing protein [Candidatus Microgenomates bacterium]
MNSLIKCPNCNFEIEISEAIRREYEEELLKAKKETEEKVRKDFEERVKLEVADLKKASEEKDKKLDEYREQELKLREEKRKLEESRKEMEVQLQRRMEEEKKKIEEEVLKKADEEHRFKDREKDKKLQDAEKQILELQRRIQQGSQQTQGEVLELDLEETLKASFPADLIEPVGKGVKGADIRQTVRSQSGIVCGVVLWESKRTKNWSEEWIAKLKEDLRAEVANIPVIVSEALPKEAENGMGIKDGVWVVSYSLFIPLAVLLRKNLLEVAYQKVTSADKSRKADLVYEYITGHEFRQQLEALVEVYQQMQEEINKERATFEKVWKVREAQIKRLISSTVNVCGSVQGLVGPATLQVRGLEFLELEEGK